MFEKIGVKFRPLGKQPTLEVKDIKLNSEQEEQKNKERKNIVKLILDIILKKNIIYNNYMID